MNEDDILFDMDEELGSYYDFNLLDLLEDNDSTKKIYLDEDSNQVKM